MADVSRRALLRAFLAAPVAVRFAPVPLPLTASRYIWWTTCAGGGAQFIHGSLKIYDTTLTRAELLAEYEATRRRPLTFSVEMG